MTKPTILFCVLNCLISCAGESPPGAVLTAAPVSPRVDAPRAEETSCRYTDSVEPVWPADPVDDCYREWTGADGVPLVWAHTRTSEEGTVTRWERDTYVTPGMLVQRVVREHGPHGAMLFSHQRFDLPPHGTLPDTYGEPATFSQRWIRDSAGRVLREEHDVGLDGVDAAEEWDYVGDTIVEHRRYHDGVLVEWQTFRPDGQPQERVGHGSRQVWLYDAAGLLTEESVYHGEELFEAIHWVMLDPDRPRERTAFRAGTDHPVFTDFWTWDEAGRLRVHDGTRWVAGYERRHRRELDEQGRETRYVEDTEDLDCRRYEQVSTWLGDTDELVHQRTTCDGRDYQLIAASFDHEARPLRFERQFYGHAGKTSHEVRRWERDGCGAAVMLTSTWGDVTTRLEHREHDGWGRITRRELVQHGGEPRVTDYVYDEAGRLVRAGPQAWSWNADGQLATIGWSEGVPAPFVAGEAVNLRLVYSCYDRADR